MIILSFFNLVIGYFKKNRENYSRKAFEQRNKEIFSFLSRKGLPLFMCQHHLEIWILSIFWLMKEHRLTKLMPMAGKSIVLICTSLGISVPGPVYGRDQESIPQLYLVTKPLNRSEARYWSLSQQGLLQPHSKSEAWQLSSQPIYWPTLQAQIFQQLTYLWLKIMKWWPEKNQFFLKKKKKKKTEITMVSSLLTLEKLRKKILKKCC